MDIPKPKISTDDPSYAASCEIALAPALHGLIARASEAGWNEETVAKALIRLAVANYNSGVVEFSTNEAITAAGLDEMKGKVQ